MRDMNTNVLIWGLFMSTTKKASVHLLPKYNENVEGYRNRAQDVVRHHAAVDLGREFRDSECFHD